MFRTYAIDPEVSSDTAALLAFIRGLGLEHGRLMAEFPGHWRRLARDYVHTLESETAKALATDLLRDIAHLGYLKVKLGLDFDGSQSWARNAIRHEQHFSAIICPSASPDQHASERVHTAASLVRNEEFWQTDRHTRFTNDSASWREVIGPFLQLGTNGAALMDPYFHPLDARFAESVERLFADHRRLTELFLHCSRDANETRDLGTNEWARICVAELQPLLRSAASITIVRWSEGPDGARPHERWIVTDRGGLQLDRGIALDGLRNKATWLSAKEATSLWNTYGKSPDSSGEFRLEDIITVHSEVT